MEIQRRPNRRNAMRPATLLGQNRYSYIRSAFRDDKLHEEECNLCSTPTIASGLTGPPCEHRFCSPCLSDYVRKCNSKGDAEHPIRCPMPHCNAEFLPTQVQLVSVKTRRREEARMSEDLAKTLQQEEDKRFAEERAAEEKDFRARHSFRCPLCLEDLGPDEARELDCAHKLCASCLEGYLESKIMEAHVAEDELVCPIPDCRTEITRMQIEGATAGTLVWEKYLDFRMRDVEWRGAVDGRMAECADPRCAARFLVPQTRQWANCPQCSKEMCTFCGDEAHKTLTCEQLKAFKSADSEFAAVMAREKWRMCPVCQTPCVRDEGCNFMRCISPQCRRKGQPRTYFCYLCGLQLTKEDHYSHFGSKGPYENECNTPLEKHLPFTPAKWSAPVQEETQDGIVWEFVNWIRAQAAGHIEALRPAVFRPVEEASPVAL